MTCNYTGVPLNHDTTEEHIIPKRLGGRIKSNSIMSSSVNNTFSKIDESLVARYRPVLLKLHDLTPSIARHNNIPITIPGIEGGQFQLTNEGPKLKQSKGTRVKIGGKFVYLFNPESELPDYYSNKASEAKDALYSDYKDSYGDSHSFWNTMISEQIDLSILKIACSSAFHICNSYPEFGLRESCMPFSKLLYQSLTDSSSCSDCIHKHMLGFQVDPKTILNYIERFHSPSTPFSHHVAIYSNLSLRTLDAAVVLFGSEVFGVRLCYNVPSTPSFIISNPILLNGTPSLHRFKPNEDFAIKSYQGKSHISTSAAPLDLEIVKKAVQESMDDLLARVDFYSECESVNKFRLAINQWIRYMRTLPTDRPNYTTSLGEICRQRTRLYFNDLCNSISSEDLALFNQFDDVGISDPNIDKAIAIELFNAHKTTILKLSKSYGIPRLQQSREFDAEVTHLYP